MSKIILVIYLIKNDWSNSVTIFRGIRRFNLL